MADFMDMLRFGPQNRMQAQEGTPSIYATPEEWEAYRMREEALNNEILMAMDARDAESARILKTAENLQRPVTGAQPAPIVQPPADPNAYVGNAGRGDSQKWDPNSILQANTSAFAQPAPAAPKNAREGAINANTKAYGVQAFTDEKGQLVLTNKAGATDAKSAMAAFTPEDRTLPNTPAAFAVAQGGAVAPNTPASVNALFQNLQKATGFDEAAGIYSSLTNALALSKAEMEASAMRFAEKTVGIPQLQKSLEQNIYLDTQRNGGRIGMPDSPITANIRKQLDNAMGRVDNVAKQWLMHNVNYAVIGTTAKNAEMYMARVSKRGDIETDLNMRLDAQRRSLEQQQTANEIQEAGAIPDYAKQRMLAFNPSLGVAVSEGGKDGAAAFARYMKQIKGNKEQSAAIFAPPEQLPTLAFQNNPYALDLVAAQEAQSTGRSKDQIKMEFEALKSKFSGKDAQTLMENEMLIMQGMRPGDKVEREKVKATLGQEKNAPEKRADFEARKATLAMNFIKRTATDRFVQDVANWEIGTPDFKAAVAKAQKETGGRASLEAVLAAYNGDLTGAEAVARHKEFFNYAKLAAEKRQSALFGGVDPTVLQATIQRSLKTKMNIVDRAGAAVGRFGSTQVPVSSIPLPIFGGALNMFNAYNSVPTPDVTQ